MIRHDLRVTADRHHLAHERALIVLLTDWVVVGYYGTVVVLSLSRGLSSRLEDHWTDSMDS